MSGRKKIRKINRQIAEEERIFYGLKLTPDERLKYLQHLRELNLGDKAREPLKKVIRLMPDSPDR
jgi:hypothetical protein